MTGTKKPASSFRSFETFKSALHQQWQQDRAIRQKVPITEAWRGCMGLAVLIDKPDDTVPHGRLCLTRNEQLTWVALRDVPIGHFPGSRTMHRRDVNYANQAVASLRYGVPFVDFKAEQRSAVDFKFMPFPPHKRPFGERPWEFEFVQPSADTLDSDSRKREFGVLNRISQEMTRFAFFAIDHSGRPMRPSWLKSRPRIENAKPYQPSHPESFVPRPYTGVALRLFPGLFWTATESQGTLSVWECPSCRHITDVKTFESSQRCATVVFENGDFAATCPKCNKRRTWFIDDGVNCRVKRRFTEPFKYGFLRAVNRGLTLSAVGPERYAGIIAKAGGDAPIGDTGYGRMRLVCHRLVSLIDLAVRDVFLPEDVHVLAVKDEELAAGACWVKVRRPAPGWWSRRDLDTQWNTLHEVLGGVDQVSYFQQLWFNAQAVRIAEAENQVLFPSELIGLAYDSVSTSPVSLWWDTSPALPYYDFSLSAAILPPIRVRRWQRLRFSLPGEFILDASIADPRFDARALEVPFDQWPRRSKAQRRQLNGRLEVSRAAKVAARESPATLVHAHVPQPQEVAAVAVAHHGLADES